MTKDEALTLALEALERLALPKNADDIFRRATAAIKEALAQPERDPWREAVAQPECLWVGLTDEDKQNFAAAQHGWEDLLTAAEAKLKEKNT